VKDWDEQPEASGPSSEGELFGATYGSPGMPRIGQPPRQMSIEQRDRERAESERKFEVRQRVERAAMLISVSALEGGKVADELLQDAAEAARKAALA
jgi:hypothetical protein